MKDDILKQTELKIAQDDGKDNDGFKDIRNGNTLDFYNEDISRKAVGKLFEEREDEDIVKGFDKDSKLGVKPMTKAPIKQIGKATPVGRISDLADDEKDEYFINAYDSSTSDEQDEDLDYSIYRKKDKTKPSVGAKPAPMGSAAAQKGKKTTNPDESDPKYYNKDYADFQEKYRNREYIPAPKKFGPMKPVKNTEENDDGYDYKDEDKLPVVKIAIVASAFVFLVILSVLVVRLNATSYELKEANLKLASIQTDEEKLNTLTLDNESLSEEIMRLNQEISRLNAELSKSPQPPVVETSGQSEGQSSPQSGGSADGESYVVVSGDSLARISKKFYGVESYVEQIKSANNLTNNNIIPGQVLKIPKI